MASRPLSPNATEVYGRDNYNFPEDLDDDVLLEIFKLLPAKDLLNIQKTCDRFRRLVNHPSLWRSVDIGTIDEDKFDEFAAAVREKSSFIRKMKCIAVTSKFLDTVVSQCHNLTHLILTGPVFYTRESLKIVAQKCSKIRHLEMGELHDIKIRPERRLRLPQCCLRGLTSLGIREFRNLETLCLREISSLEQYLVAQLLPSLKNLRVLDVHASPINIRMITTICERPPKQLEKFSVTAGAKEIRAIELELQDRRQWKFDVLELHSSTETNV